MKQPIVGDEIERFVFDGKCRMERTWWRALLQIGWYFIGGLIFKTFFRMSYEYRGETTLCEFTASEASAKAWVAEMEKSGCRAWYDRVGRFQPFLNEMRATRIAWL